MLVVVVAENATLITPRVDEKKKKKQDRAHVALLLLSTTGKLMRHGTNTNDLSIHTHSLRQHCPSKRLYET